MSEEQDLKQENKNELEDSQKTNLAKRGSGAIIILAVLLLMLWMLNPFSSNKEQKTPVEETTAPAVEQKVFNPVEQPPFNFQPADAYQTNDNSNNPFGSVEQKTLIVKGLSSAALTVQKSETQNVNNIAGAQQQEASNRAAEIRKMASDMQGQLNALVAGSTASGTSASDYENSFIENNAVAITAKKSVLDPNLSLDKGTFIPCVLKTAIISSIAGNIACIITNDVYSTAGTVLLIEKGSIVQGYFRSGALQPGMNRLFVVWEEIKTPKQIIINVNAPATDALGGSGIEGWVDNHYLQRFGGAILLSMIDDAFSAIFNNKDGRDYTMNTRENTVEMANTVLESTINIPPTLYKNQGDIVGIYVNKDVDFSKVYRLQRAPNARIPKW